MQLRDDGCERDADRTAQQQPAPHGRPSFDLWLLQKMPTHFGISLEDALAEYIQEFDLSVRKHLDEPTHISGYRTRLAVLDGTSTANRAKTEEDLHNYLVTMRAAVTAFDIAPTEVRDLLVREYAEKEEAQAHSRQKYLFLHPLLGLVMLVVPCVVVASALRFGSGVKAYTGVHVEVLMAAIFTALLLTCLVRVHSARKSSR